MKKFFCVVASAAACVLSVNVHAIPFTPELSRYAFSSSQYTVGTAANNFFNTNFGITLFDTYLYKDGRDAFDGVGIANGSPERVDEPQVTGRINFSDSTDFVSIDFLSIQASTYSAFSADGKLLGEFCTPDDMMIGTATLSGGDSLISYLTLTSVGGYAAINSLTYNYDGVTDGKNTDIRATTVPEPSSWGLVAIGLVGLALSKNNIARKKFVA